MSSHQMKGNPHEFQADPASRRALHEQLYILTERSAKEVRITSVSWPEGKRWVALVIGVNGKEAPLRQPGLHHQAAMILHEVFPDADWNRAQDYDVATGILRPHLVRLPASLRGDEQ